VINLQSFTAIAETGTTDQIFAGLESWVQQDVGAVIYSCSTFDLVARNSRRIYSNLPEIYPVSGLKDIVPNRWTEQVLDARKTFVANALDEIAQVFPDHPIIKSLGCGAVINMPVFLAGRFMGTVNVLHEAGYYTDARIASLKALRPAAMLAFAAFAAAQG
jgi:hypothetical protein